MPRFLEKNLSTDRDLPNLVGASGLKPPFLLIDSARPEFPGSRWSIFAEAPTHTVVAVDGAVLMDGSEIRDEVFSLLGQLHRNRSFKNELPDEAPWPGAVMALSYDLKNTLEPTCQVAQEPSGCPDLVAHFYDMWIVEDHETGARRLLGYDHDLDGTFAVRFQEFAERLAKAESQPRADVTAQAVGVRPSEAEYRSAVRQILEGIEAGDWYQANMTRRYQGIYEGSHRDLYKRLRDRSTAAFGALMEFGHQAILSASPERFVRIRGNRIETCPVKGTRPRLRDDVADEAIRSELWTSTKDNAELTMIVDLCRNDLARIAEPGSVVVDEAKRLESHAGVHHLVATVSGQLSRPWRLEDLIRAVFPGGSITGAPKVAAMKALGELEPQARGFYTGSLFLLDAGGDADSNILIRTLLCDHGTLSFQVGGGIVVDSEIEAELQETRDKARTLLEALGLTHQNFES